MFISINGVSDNIIGMVDGRPLHKERRGPIELEMFAGGLCPAIDCLGCDVSYEDDDYQLLLRRIREVLPRFERLPVVRRFF